MAEVAEGGGNRTGDVVEGEVEVLEGGEVGE